jgi:hypothetical protein
MVSQRALDSDIVDVLCKNFEELNCIRVAAQSSAVREYGEISNKVASMGVCNA